MKYNLGSKAWVEIVFEGKGSYVSISVEGQITYKGFSDIFDIVVSSEEYKPSMGRIWDLSQADLSELDMNSLQGLTEFIQLYPKGIKDSKVALVSLKKINMGTCKLFKTYSTDVDAIVEVFEKFEDAAEWIAS